MESINAVGKDRQTDTDREILVDFDNYLTDLTNRLSSEFLMFF